jgi:hypothetical protein
MKKWMWIAAMVFVTLGLPLSGFSCKAPVTLYEDTEHGFSIEYPEGWAESTTERGTMFTFEFQNPEGPLTAEVRVEYRAAKTILADYVREVKEYMKYVPQFKLISENDVTINGILGYELVGEGDLGTGIVEKFKYVYLARDKQGFWVGVRAKPAAFAQQEELIATIVGSFKLLPTYTYVVPPPSTESGTYTSAEYGFSITYPAGWVEVPPAAPGEIVTLAPEARMPRVCIRIDPIPGGTSLAEFGARVSQDLAQQWANYESFSEGEITLDDGTPAYEIVFSGTMEGHTLKAKYVLVTRETQAFYISGFSMPASFEDDEAVLDGVIRSFRLE